MKYFEIFAYLFHISPHAFPGQELFIFLFEFGQNKYEYAEATDILAES